MEQSTRKDYRKLFPTTYRKMDKITHLLETTPAYRNFRNKHAQIKFNIYKLPISLRSLGFPAQREGLTYKELVSARNASWYKMIKAIKTMFKNSRIKVKKWKYQGAISASLLTILERKQELLY